MRLKTEISTVCKSRVTSNVQNVYILGIRRSKWEDNVKMDRTALRKGGRGIEHLA